VKLTEKEQRRVRIDGSADLGRPAQTYGKGLDDDPLDGARKVTASATIGRWRRRR